MRQNWREIKAGPISAEECATKLWSAAKTKAAGRGLSFNLNYQVVLEKVRAGRCEVTGIAFDMRRKPDGGGDFPFRASLDRIENSVGYTDSNVQVVVKMYNNAKQCWNDEDVLAMSIGMVTHQLGLILATK